MRVGVVNFMKSGHPVFLYDALGDDILIVSHKTDWLSVIRTSRIKRWFLTGSVYDVLQPGTPQISAELLTLTNTEFLLPKINAANHLIQLMRIYFTHQAREKFWKTRRKRLRNMFIKEL